MTIATVSGNTAAGLVVFDGDCHLCNRSVHFIRRRSKAGKFVFIARGSEELKQMNPSLFHFVETHDSLVYVRHGRPLIRSSAALHIAKELKGAWPLLFGFILVPRPLRDAIYRLIAGMRNKIYRDHGHCDLNP